jgi:septum formation protein
MAIARHGEPVISLREMVCLVRLWDGFNMRIVLASESQFRRRALDMLGLAYEICPSGVDEKAVRDNNPAELTRKLAEAKARKVASECPDAVVVSGDAVVSKGARIYEKPRDQDEAAQFLRELSGSEFQFVTALAVIHSQTGNMLSTVEVSNISFRQLVQCEIQAYISKYDVLRYAGAFESDAVLRFAERISGSYNFVTALPVSRLIVFLRAQGIDI